MSARTGRTARLLAPLLLPLALLPPVPAAATSGDRPVLVTGAAAGALLGEPIQSIRLLRWTGGGFAPIPFQIDPRERRARPGRRARPLYVLPPAGAPDLPGGRPLGPDDEIVFMRSDLGPPPPAGGRPPGIRAGVIIEVGAAGAAVLGAFDRPPPRSPRRYLHAQAGGRRMEARGYTVAFSESHPGVLEELRLHPGEADAGRPRGAPGAARAPSPAPDILDRVKVRVDGTLLHVLPFRRDEEDIETRVVGVRAGPVRVVRICRHRLPLVAGFRSPWVEEAQIFHPDGFAFPLWLAKPPRMSRLLTRLAFRVGPDWSPAALGMRVRAAGSAVDFEVDGRMDAAEAAFEGEGASWSVLRGEGGALLSSLERSAEDPGGVAFALRYRDDLEHEDGPEAHRGEIGALAYGFDGAARLPAGEYRWTVRTRVLRRYAPGDERALLGAMAPAAPSRVRTLPAGRDRAGGGRGSAP